MKLNSVQIKDRQSQLITRCKEIVETCKKEVREMTEEEVKEFEDSKSELEQLKAQLEEIKEKLAAYDNDVPSMDKEDDLEDMIEENGCGNIDNKKEKRKKMQNFSITKEIRSAIENGSKRFTINADKRALTTSGSVVETEVQGILEPLYANSVLTKLGVKWYNGLPQGEISVPVMSKGNVGWADEVAAAGQSVNAFTNKVLKPKRLTAYVDISLAALRTDTIGIEQAIRRDIVNAINDKLEATILGDGAKTDNQPAGIFNGVEFADGSTFAKIVANEAKIEDANVYGNIKYLLSTSAKADLRAMPKSSKNTQLVMEGGEVDGVEAITTSNVKTEGAYVVGDFSNLAVGSWGDLMITVDEYSQAVNGCVRLVVNAYFDAVILRPEAFVFGKTRGIA